MTIAEEIKQCEFIVNNYSCEGINCIECFNHGNKYCNEINSAGYAKAKLIELYSRRIRKNGSKTQISINAVKRLKELEESDMDIKEADYTKERENLKKEYCEKFDLKPWLDRYAGGFEDYLIEKVLHLSKEKKQSEIEFVVGGGYKYEDHLYTIFRIYGTYHGYQLMNINGSKHLGGFMKTKEEVIKKMIECNMKYTGKTLQDLIKDK